MLYLKPDMASLATGSVSFPTNMYENPPEFVDGLANGMLTHNKKPEIEVFDVAMLYNAINLIMNLFQQKRSVGKPSSQ